MDNPSKSFRESIIAGRGRGMQRALLKNRESSFRPFFLPKRDPVSCSMGRVKPSDKKGRAKRRDRGFRALIGNGEDGPGENDQGC